MTDFLKYDMTDVWASSGDKIAPDSAKIAAGWGVEVVPRQWWNWFENRQDNNIAYLMQKGIPEWDEFTEYQINKSYVQRNGITYKATTTHINSDPVALTNWVRAFIDWTVAGQALGSLTPAADRAPYFTNGTTAALMTVTSFARTLLDDTTNTNARTTLGAQASHANLTALSGVTAAANALPYFTSTTVMGVTTFTAFARTLLDDADATAMRATLGLGTAAVANVTTSQTDTTANAQLKVGDFGLGASVSPSVNDANTISVSGYWQIPTTAGGGLNGPTSFIASVGWMILHTARAATTGFQIASPLTSVSTNKGRIFTRQNFSGTWSAWVEQTTSGTIATQAEAEAGADDTKMMTPLKTLQAVTNYGVLKSGGSMTGALTMFTGSGVDGDFVVGDLSGNAAGRVRFTKSSNVNYIQSGLTSASGSTADLSIGSPILQTTPRLYIKGSTGNVLINTATDDGTNKFQVNGATKITGALTLTTALSVANGGTGGTTAAAARTGLQVENALIEKGNVDLSGGVYPTTPTQPSIWNVSVAGTVGGQFYGVGDGLIYSVVLGTFRKAGGGVATTTIATYSYVATAGQATFSGADTQAVVMAYTPGAIIVNLNGATLNYADYTATNGTSIVLGVAATAGDILQVVAVGSFAVANTYTIAQADSLFLNAAGDAMTGAFNEAPVITIPSAASTPIGAAAANTLSVLGTVNISSFDNYAAGARRCLIFNAVLTLIYNGAGPMLLPGNANITTAPGDIAEFVSLGAGNWRCISYTKFNGAPVPAGVKGTVSQSGGIPTGAIIESGSNAQGNYTKWADGTMIAYAYVNLSNVAITTPAGTGLFYAPLNGFAFPVAFVGNVVSNTIVVSGGGLSWATQGSNLATTTQSAGWYIMNPTSVTHAVTAGWHAMGRWY